jgi:hypothetical protein
MGLITIGRMALPLVGDTVRKFTLSSDERENGVPEV